MSEFQHYAFRAIDRPLTPAEMAELRALSTRATITPRSFTNEYQWGNFKGDPDELMARYFDAHTYVTNWGTRRFMLRFPAAAIDREEWAPYLVEGRIDLRQVDRFIVVTFEIDDERSDWPIDDGDWDPDAGYRHSGYADVEGGGADVVAEADEWLPDLAPLRDALMEGDLSALYLAWLLAVEAGFVEVGATEPSVPAGILHPSHGLERWASFLGLDSALRLAASRGAAPATPEADASALAAWIGTLPVAEKDVLLVRLMMAPEARVGSELRRRLAQARRPRSGTPATAGRTVEQILAEADEVRADRERAAAEAARQEALQAAQLRAAQLEYLAKREEAAWQEIEQVFDLPLKGPAKGAAYDAKAALLKDLRELATKDGRMMAFEARVAELRRRHEKRSAFWRRFDA